MIISNPLIIIFFLYHSVGNSCAEACSLITVSQGSDVARGPLVFKKLFYFGKECQGCMNYIYLGFLLLCMHISFLSCTEYFSTFILTRESSYSMWTQLYKARSNMSKC